MGFLAAEGGGHRIEERQEGWKAGHFKNNLSLNKDYVFRAERLFFQDGYEKTKEVLRKHKKITALFCVNDEMAAGALRAAHEVGRKVPQDLSVVGFDNIAMSNYTDPPLTTIIAAQEYMGKLAVTRVLEMIDNKDTPARRQEVPVELIIRNSTARPS